MTSRAIRLLGFLTLLGWYAPGAPLAGQAGRQIRDAGLQDYYGDSLRVGAQRVILADGRQIQLAADESIPSDGLLTVRVGPTAMVGAPTRGVTRVALPDRGGNGTDMLLIPVVLIEGGGLRYDARTATYRGSIRVGVEDSLSRTASEPLPTPVAFLITGDADDIAPSDPEVDHSNLPFASVELAEATPGDSVRLNVRTSFHPDGVDVSVPIQRDSLILVSSPERVQGFGLEKASLTLGPAASHAGAVVALSTDAGNLEASEIELGASGTGSITLRSYGVGTATVTARNPAFRDAQVAVAFVFPLLFLTTSLLGGAVGGAAAWLMKKRGAKKGAQTPQFVPYVLSGAPLGLLSTVAYAVGINVTAFNPTVSTGQAVLFALAGLVGFGGASAFKLGFAADVEEGGSSFDDEDSVDHGNGVAPEPEPPTRGQ